MQTPHKLVLIWTTGPRVGNDERRRSCRMAFGYTVARARSQVITSHDCKITRPAILNWIGFSAFPNLFEAVRPTVRPDHVGVAEA